MTIPEIHARRAVAKTMHILGRDARVQAMPELAIMYSESALRLFKEVCAMLDTFEAERNFPGSPIR